MPDSLRMGTTSTTRGTLVITHSPPPRMVEAKIGNAAFFAPLIWTSPRSGVPPVMTVRSIVSVPTFRFAPQLPHAQVRLRRTPAGGIDIRVSARQSGASHAPGRRRFLGSVPRLETGIHPLLAATVRATPFPGSLPPAHCVAQTAALPVGVSSNRPPEYRGDS